MATVLVNGLASTAGGGLTYLRNILPRLAANKGQHHFHVLVPHAQFAASSAFNNTQLVVEGVVIPNGARRWIWEQALIRRLIKTHQVEVLVTLGNFGLLAAPAPQILFQRNALYFSAEFARDLLQRKLYLAWLAHQTKSWLARILMRTAVCNVTPSGAFAQQLREYGLRTVEAVPFGFDYSAFIASSEPLPVTQQTKLRPRSSHFRLLFVSHYNYFRNFETLLRALPSIKRQVHRATGKDIQLVLTTTIERGVVTGGYDATAAAQLIERLGVQGDIAMLGQVAYESLHQLYRQCDLYICPSYAESFGHPLVEAMALGLPLVVSDLSVQREICGAAALYFQPFDECALAEHCARLLADPALYAELKQAGLDRSRAFSWDEHGRRLDELLERYTKVEK